MRRREMIVLLGAAGLARPHALRAAQTTMLIVGFLHSGSLSGRETQVAAFREGLADSGYIEGKNVVIEYRWVEGNYDLLPGLVSDLLRRQVAVIAASPRRSGLVEKQATTTTRIVGCCATNADGRGLAAMTATCRRW